MTETNGNGVYAVNCQVFSDLNCNSYIGQTGNHVGTSQKCYSFANAKSVKVRPWDSFRSANRAFIDFLFYVAVLLQVLNMSQVDCWSPLIYIQKSCSDE